MTKKQKSLPGDLKIKQFIDQVIRVNHAGEYGAKRIYQGQLAVLKKHKVISHMMEQELEHLEYFTAQMKKLKGRPTALSPIWSVGGFVLGALTAALGEKAAMACTVAVEEVIVEHYDQQLQQLSKLDSDEISSELLSKIKKFRNDELEHHNEAIHYGAEHTVGYGILTNIVKTITKGAILLSKRI